MSLQTKLRICYMIAVMYKEEHETVISPIARYGLVNIFQKKWLIVLGRETKRGQGDDRRGEAGYSDLYKSTSPVPLPRTKQGHCCLHNC